MYFRWKPYVPVAERRRKAKAQRARAAKAGKAHAPIVLAGRTIAATFWGKSWCENLERYSDFENRLPRGRSYLRNGAVLDLQITSGAVAAKVMGSDLYTVNIKVAPVPHARWSALCQDCTGGIDSLVELLQGRFSNGVMERICRRGEGLFPSPGEIDLDCSCPDWADMCKHVAAVLYGVGARLDAQPELLFQLRRVDGKDLIAAAGAHLPQKAPASPKVLDEARLGEIFGIEIAAAAPATPRARRPANTDGKRGAAAAAKKKQAHAKGTGATDKRRKPAAKKRRKT